MMPLRLRRSLYACARGCILLIFSLMAPQPRSLEHLSESIHAFPQSRKYIYSLMIVFLLQLPSIAYIQDAYHTRPCARLWHLFCTSSALWICSFSSNLSQYSLGSHCNGPFCLRVIIYFGSHPNCICSSWCMAQKGELGIQHSKSASSSPYDQRRWTAISPHRCGRYPSFGLTR